MTRQLNPCGTVDAGIIGVQLAIAVLFLRVSFAHIRERVAVAALSLITDIMVNFFNVMKMSQK